MRRHGRPAGSDFVDRILPARFRQRRLGGQFGDEGGGGGQGHGYGRGRRQGHQRGRSDELSRAKPEMFDAWIEKGQRTVDNTLKWEAAESVPLSAKITTGPVGTAMAEVSSRAGRDSVEEEDEEKRCLSVQQSRVRQAATGSSTLQVAVLLQMPSPPSHTVTEAQNDISVQGELVIGLIEAPWTREHPSSREGEEATTS